MSNTHTHLYIHTCTHVQIHTQTRAHIHKVMHIHGILKGSIVAVRWHSTRWLVVTIMWYMLQHTIYRVHLSDSNVTGRYFNFRTTRFLTEEGFYNFHNWFDDRAWYPLGRIIGGTIYPGLMVTSALLYHILHFLNVTIQIRNVCVFLAPFFSSLTVIVTFHLTKELKVRVI